MKNLHNINYEVHGCPHCNSRNRIYEDTSQKKLISNSMMCRFCRMGFELTNKTYLYKVDKNKYVEVNEKMKVEKEDVGSLGEFLTPSDIGEYEGDKTTLIICEGVKTREVEFDGKTSVRLVINVDSETGFKDENGKKMTKKFSLSPTNKNILIEQFADETDIWVGKKIEVLLKTSNVGKTGLQIAILKKKK